MVQRLLGVVRVKTDLAPQNRDVDLSAFLFLIRLVVEDLLRLDRCIVGEADVRRRLRLLLGGVNHVAFEVYPVRAVLLHFEGELLVGWDRLRATLEVAGLFGVPRCLLQLGTLARWQPLIGLEWFGLESKPRLVEGEVLELLSRRVLFSDRVLIRGVDRSPCEVLPRGLLDQTILAEENVF